MSSGAKLKGADDIRRTLSVLAERFPREVAASVYRRAEEIMARSKSEFVPVAEKGGGTLRASGHVMPAKIEGRKISVTMGYGGPSDAYALAAHEHLSEFSPPSWRSAEADGNGVTFHPEGRGPKYLEIPLMGAIPTMAEDIALDVKLNKMVK